MLDQTKSATRIVTSLLALAGFLLISTFFFGYGGLLSLNQNLIGDTGTDKLFYVWCLSWWPHAIFHGLNPFVTHAAWAPVGFNLTKTTPIPGLALLALPITVWIGPIAAHNVIALATPGLAAWTMFLLCRYITGNTIPALFAGYVFGFCSYEVAHMFGHLNLTAPIFLLPLLVYLSVRYTNGELRAGYFVVTTTLGTTLLFLISTEVYTYYIWFGAISLGLSYGFMRPERQIITKLFTATILANLITGIIVSPYLVYFFLDHHLKVNVNVLHTHSHDLLEMVIPTPFLWFSNQNTSWLSKYIHPNIVEQNAYLGLPLFVILALFWKQFWDRPVAKVLFSFTCLALIATLGNYLRIANVDILTFPWHYVFSLPIIKFCLFNRLGLLASFGIAIILSIWLSESPTKSYWRYGLAIIAIIFILPTMNSANRLRINSKFLNPPFITEQIYKQYINPNENVLFIPFGAKHSPTLWQALTHFYFRMPDDIIGAQRPKGLNNEVVSSLGMDITAINPIKFKQFLNDAHIDAIVVSDNAAIRYRELLKTLIVQPQSIGGVKVYRLKGQADKY